MMIAPPKEIPAARLFRLLLARPYAVAPLTYRIRGAEAIPLRVRALRSADELAISDASVGAPAIAGSCAASELVLRALLAPGGPAFASVETVDAMGTDEVMRLASAVRAALNVISPTYVLADSALWMARLKEGARANWSEALSLGGCSDVAYGFGVGRATERPDRYFGIPLADMTDGQWMVYRAARAVFEEAQKK
jgi:hypothetical protein